MEGGRGVVMRIDWISYFHFSFPYLIGKSSQQHLLTEFEVSCFSWTDICLVYMQGNSTHSHSLSISSRNNLETH
jgi:hypothetical protein